jgi:hypothetical protein
MDRYWYGFENGYPAGEVAEVMGETTERVEALFRGFERKKRTTEYLRMAPVRDYLASKICFRVSGFQRFRVSEFQSFRVSILRNPGTLDLGTLEPWNSETLEL